MKRVQNYWFAGIFFIVCLILTGNPAIADDTCIFEVTADDVPPNIMLLLDNGAEMEQIAWHPGYDNSKDCSPKVDESSRLDVVSDRENGKGFFNKNGYAVISTGGAYYLVPILDNLEPGTCCSVDKGDVFLKADTSDTANKTGTWTINERKVTLPAEPSTVEVDGVIDRAIRFRYSKNYLNWIFFAKDVTGANFLYDPDHPAVPIDPLPNKSRFYYAKKGIFSVAKLAENKARFGIMNFTENASGATNVQPLKMVLNTPLAANPEENKVTSEFYANVNNMHTVDYSPLAEGLASVGMEFASPSTKENYLEFYCQGTFAIVISPGVSSKDQTGWSQYVPATLEDYDGDDEGIGEGNIKADEKIYPIPVNLEGSTWLDDVAYYLYTHDIPKYKGAEGFQNISTYTIGFMGDQVSNLFLTNTSNNGNGNVNLYDTNHPEYGKYHYVAENPDALAQALLDAVNEILSETSTFTAPVVPVTRTTSGNRIYLAFFKPSEENFWEGNVTKFGLKESLEGEQVIIDRYDNPATWPNGAMKEDAEAYWETKDWATVGKNNHIDNSFRNIYTYLGSPDLTASSNEFKSSNTALTAAVLGLGDSTHTPKEIINYVRGADVFDEDVNGDNTENRKLITGDVLHSEPTVLYYNSSTTMIYFGSNDGMLHAVRDSDGSEAWAFIPPEILDRLKDMVEGTGHQYYVDFTPKVYIVNDNKDGEIGAGEQVILVCGLRKGGTSYFALDVTDPARPLFQWTIDQGTISELGETWSEPRFGLVKTSDADTTGTPVCFIGGGYSSDNSKGKAVIALKVQTGAVVKQFSGITGMDYSIPSAVAVLDTDNNGFVDKLYVGDLGSQMWRFGKFTDSSGNQLVFPNSDENINNWEAQIFFRADSGSPPTEQFFYPPSIALEKAFDVVFMGTGDREDPCTESSANGIYCVKDTHGSDTWEQKHIVNVTDPAATPPNLNDPTGDVDGNGYDDQGWYLQLASGEKVLAEGVVFYKVFYITTFAPNVDDPCVPGGDSRLYALSYLTGEAVIDIDGDEGIERSAKIGGGIGSKPVLVISEEGSKKLLVSVGSTNPEEDSERTGAGVRAMEPLSGPGMHPIWWIEL